MKSYLDDFSGAYDDTSPYELDNRLILNWYPQRVLRLVSGGSLLELGVGHGYSSLALTPHFSRHVIVEGSQQLAARFCQRRGTAHIEVVNDLFETFETQERFDLVVMGFVLEHVEKPEQILRQYKRFLSPDGVVIAVAPNCRALNRRIGHEAGLLPEFETLSEADLALGHRRLFTVESLHTLAESCGYDVARTEGILLKPITTEQMLRLDLSDDVLQAMLKVGVEYPELCVAIMVELLPGRE